MKKNRGRKPCETVPLTAPVKEEFFSSLRYSKIRRYAAELGVFKEMFFLQLLCHVV
jgi:hypothetical protein